jgi:uncharacterized phage protein (TIGR01671 family)
MREIKFRAWEEKNKEMHYNFEWVSSGEEGDDWIVFKSNRQKLSSKPHPFENPWFKKQFHIMQFIDLEDENEKEIYEGDIISFFDDILENREDKRKKGLVEFDDGYFFTKELFVLDNKELISNLYEVKVIGNIFENSELS